MCTVQSDAFILLLISESKFINSKKIKFKLIDFEKTELKFQSIMIRSLSYLNLKQTAKMFAHVLALYIIFNLNYVFDVGKTKLIHIQIHY